MRFAQLPSCLLALATVLLTPPVAHAVQIRISAQALERTLNKQLFNGEGDRYYLHGKSGEGCFAYAQDPKVSFDGDRIVVHVTVRAKLGAAMHGRCLGLDLGAQADVSVVPDAEGETVGFRDPRIDRLSESRELNFFLIPFLSGKLPRQMQVNVADLLRQSLASSLQTTGYRIKLDDLNIHSMQVNGNSLVVDFDGDLSVN